MDKKRVRHRCGCHRHTLPQDDNQSAASFYSRKRIKSENGSVHIELTHQDPSLIHPLTPKMDVSAQGSSPRSEIVHLAGGVKEDGMVLKSVLTAPRAPEAMFFPALKDSSLKAEAEERARREAELQRNLQGTKLPLEDRHVRNAAILPDLRDPPAPNLLDAQEMVLKSILTAPMAPKLMSFPALKDSSLKAKGEERARQDSELQGNLQGTKRPLEDRHVRNAAILPDLRDPPAPSFLTAQEMNLISGHACPEGPLGIHNRTIEQYKQIYNSVVDPVRRSTPSRSLALGRSNKQRLWEALGGPSLHWANVGQAGQLQVWESYDVTALHSVVHIDLDTSLEPDSPPQPRRKRARH